MLAFLEQLWAIARTTFTESVRQPVLLVAVLAATILVILSNPFAAYTMEDDQRLFIDLALSTIFTAEMILAAFLATSVLNREIENRTALMVLSKPVGRPVFIIGKFLGVAAALLASLTFLALVFLLVENHGTLQTVRTPYHQPVLAFGSAAVLLAVGAGVWGNFFYGWSFTSTTVLLGLPLLALAYALSLLFGPEWDPQSIGTDFRPELLLAISGMAIAVLVLVAVAIAASTRLGQLPTLVVTMIVFLLGLLSDWMFGRPIARLEETFARLGEEGVGVQGLDHLQYLGYRVAYAVVPDFQIFWLADALTQKRPIPLDYFATIVPYGLLVIAGTLALATALFQRREVS